MTDRPLAMDPVLTPALAGQYAQMVMGGLVREYPNQPGFRLTGDEDLRPPRQVHPAFYGCYDWHSAVHGHWLLIRLLRTDLLTPSTATEAGQLLRRHLSTDNLKIEKAYLEQPGCASFEWPYGWAWLLALHAEAKAWDPAVAEALQPLADHLAGQIPIFLSRMSHPQRSGQHGDTGFSLALVLESGREDLASTIRAEAMRLYGQDADYPWDYERGPYDFTSSGLNTIDLMSRVLEAGAFRDWLERFWPGLQDGEFGVLDTPATCPDPSDGKLSHLIGLNLDRARCLERLAACLEADHPTTPRLRELAQSHRDAGLPGVCSGHWAGDHWLATFAVRLLTRQVG